MDRNLSLSMHMLSIIPLATGILLLVIGLYFGERDVMAMAAVFIVYGSIAHTKNVSVIRRRLHRLGFS